MRFLALITAISVAISGCASTAPASQWRPMVDTAGADNSRYEQDLQECRAYAEANPEADPQQAAAEGAKTDAIRSGALGVGTMAAAGLMTGGLALIPLAAMGAFTALTGGMIGGMGGSQLADVKYRNIVSNCMVGRGYRVIG